MIQDFLTVIRTRTIFLFFITSLIFRFFFLFFLPNSPLRFGPDEGTYAALAKYVAQGLPVEMFPSFGPGLYNSSRSIILPSALFVKLGIFELDAVRLTSTLYGLASLIIIAMSFVAYQKRFSKSPINTINLFDNKSIFLIGIYAFVPSNFIWSIIGLRESGSQFWLNVTFYFLIKLFFSSGWTICTYAILVNVSLILAHGARPETALVFAIVAIVFSVPVGIVSRKWAPTLVILSGLFLGQAFTTTPSAQVNVLANEQQNVKVDVEPSLLDHVLSDLSIVKTMDLKRNVNAIDAVSALPKSECISLPREYLPLLKCNVKELPYRLLAFLFRPLPFLDHGSISLTLAAFENLGWMVLFVITLILCIQNYINFSQRFIILALGTYIISFSIAAALYEGNLGTAFRHKSSILWPLILLVMFSQMPKPFRQKLDS